MSLSQSSAGSIIAQERNVEGKKSNYNLVVVGKEEPCQEH